MARKPIKCKVRILCALPEVYPKYQPKVGEVYEAYYKKTQFRSGGKAYNPVCVIEVLDKKICLRKGEYEILEGL
jgi:hypothetical protein